MSTPGPITISTSLPGIDRDGTFLDTNYHLDGQWVRFYRKQPKKIGGYLSITQNVPYLVHGMESMTVADTIYTHLGSAANLTQVQSNNNAQLLAIADRTPASDFASDVNNLWQFDYLYDPTTAQIQLIAHAAPSLADISSKTETYIFAGQVDSESALTPTAMLPQSGGILVLEPYLLTFGNGGRVDMSNPNDLTSPPFNSTSVTNAKIIKGLPLRGTGGLPAGLLWSLTSLVRAVFVGQTQGVFGFDTLTDSISPLSAQGIVEQDGIYYWADTGRFMLFNGVVQEIPNELNLRFFFDNLNMTYREKVFAFPVPQWGEIWWCFPFGSATECNHAVIYNYRYQTWYDTPLPGSGRSAGTFAAPYNYPLLMGIDANGAGQYPLWAHENGVDQVLGSQISAIRSYYRSMYFSMITQQQTQNKNLRVSYIEPDFRQTGDMSVTLIGQSNARAPTVSFGPRSFPDLSNTPLPASEQLVEFKKEQRLVSFQFESNTRGGDYIAGRTLAHVEPTDGRVTT